MTSFSGNKRFKYCVFTSLSAELHREEKSHLTNKDDVVFHHLLPSVPDFRLFRHQQGLCANKDRKLRLCLLQLRDPSCPAPANESPADQQYLFELILGVACIAVVCTRQQTWTEKEKLFSNTSTNNTFSFSPRPQNIWCAKRFVYLQRDLDKNKSKWNLQLTAVMISNEKAFISLCLNQHGSQVASCRPKEVFYHDLKGWHAQFNSWSVT